jgi:hypothetical protein
MRLAQQRDLAPAYFVLAPPYLKLCLLSRRRSYESRTPLAKKNGPKKTPSPARPLPFLPFLCFARVSARCVDVTGWCLRECFARHSLSRLFVRVGASVHNPGGRDMHRIRALISSGMTIHSGEAERIDALLPSPDSHPIGSPRRR